MSPLIPDNILDQILDRCDIVEIISSYIPLKRAGRNYKALCPFHQEKTPSFIVNPEKGIFHCFGCGVGGNLFSFIMKYERLEFFEVVKMLAKKAGVTLPERSSSESTASSSLIAAMYKIHELATAYFQNILNSPSSERAREYLVKRGLRNETVREFNLGFAPDSWDGLLNYLKKEGYNDDIIEKSGLTILRPDKSGYYDRFRNRLIFPIFNQRDKIIAFAGRVLDDSLPKYMNSPETPVYNKSRTLFGLNLAKKNIYEKDLAVIVEGYMDLMVPYQDGVRHIIASCGTALTPEHIKVLRRHSRNVTMVYDSDKAGQMATLRGLDLLLAEDMSVGVLQLPKSFDPDSFVRRYGVEAFQKLLEEPISLFEYKLNILNSMYGSDKIDSKVKIASEMLSTISKINNAILKSEYIKKLSESLGLDEGSLRTELKKMHRRHDGTYDAPLQPPLTPLKRYDTASLSIADKIVIGLMIEDNELISLVKKRLDFYEFCNKSAQKIAEFIFTFHEQNRPVSYSTLMNQLNIDGLDNILSEIATIHGISVDRKKNLDDCILWIKKNNLKKDLDELRDHIKEAQNRGEQDKLRELVMRYNKIVKECSRFGRGQPVSQKGDS